VSVNVNVESLTLDIVLFDCARIDLYIMLFVSASESFSKEL
jgi:hypothetical protein